MVRKLFFNKDENENCMTIMEKKKYVTPECVVVELETSVSILSGSNYTGNMGEDNEFNDPNDMSNRHRGEWGNLWK
jgi:hypothetical protein